MELRIVHCLRRLVVRLELVAAVSGRSLAQLSSMLEVEGVVCVGNHGLEWWEDGRASVDPEAEPYLPAIAATLRHLRDRPDLPAVLVAVAGPETPTALVTEAGYTVAGIDAVASFLEQTADRLDR